MIFYFVSIYFYYLVVIYEGLLVRISIFEVFINKLL